MKLTPEQRTWIECELVPACHMHAHASYTKRGKPCPALGVTAGLMQPIDYDAFILVAFWTGIDDDAAKYVEAALEGEFHGLCFTVRAEW